MARPIILCWSGGKDSVLALDRLLSDPQFDVIGLLTMLTEQDQQVSMHGVSRELIESQASAVGQRLVTVEVPRWPVNQIYAQAFAYGIEKFEAGAACAVAFGDLFLEDIREFREQLCGQLGRTAVFPLWGTQTTRLAGEFLNSGYRAVVCCADAARLTADFVGCRYDAAFLQRLPGDVDPCGERGEFHTFVTFGMGWNREIPVNSASPVLRDGFWYADLKSASDDSSLAGSVEFSSDRELRDV